MGTIRRHLSYPNVMSTIAVFGVLAGGGAYAASKIGASDIAKNAIRSKQIKNNAVKTPKVKDDAVTLGKLADNSVNSAKVKDNSLTSSDIDQAIFGLAPVAVVLIGGNGAVASEAHRAPITGPPTLVDHSVGGIYTFSFPGLSLGGTDVPLCTLRGLGSSGEISAFTGGPGILTVYVWSSAGAGQDNSFQCAIYDL